MGSLRGILGGAIVSPRLLPKERSERLSRQIWGQREKNGKKPKKVFELKGLP